MMLDVLWFGDGRGSRLVAGSITENEAGGGLGGGTGGGGGT
jgi:hypothetical protein